MAAPVPSSSKKFPDVSATLMRKASRLPARFISVIANAAALFRYWLPRYHRVNAARLFPGPTGGFQSSTGLSGSENGRLRSSNAFSTLKTAVLAPIESASAATAKAVLTGPAAVQKEGMLQSSHTRSRPSRLPASRYSSRNWNSIGSRYSSRNRAGYSFNSQP